MRTHYSFILCGVCPLIFLCLQELWFVVAFAYAHTNYIFSGFILHMLLLFHSIVLFPLLSSTMYHQQPDYFVRLVLVLCFDPCVYGML
jgi:hypothetical protein